MHDTGGEHSEMRVWVNGTFDILHVGHVALLEFASGHGRLRVGIDSDRRVRELKGDDRPFNNQDDRRRMLESLRCVGDVVLFDSPEELRGLLRDYSPDIMVVGDDYKDRGVIGSEHAGRVLFFSRMPGHSTTRILNHWNR